MSYESKALRAKPYYIMNKELYSTADLDSYLLGTASVDDTEQMDELSVVDPSFANSLDAREKDLIDSFVQGELTGAYLHRFETHYLISPLRREKVLFAKALQGYAAKKLSAIEMVSTSSLAAISERSKGGIAGFLSSLNIFGGSKPMFGFALAAAALIVVSVGGWMIVKNLTGSRSGVEVASNPGVNMTEPVALPSPSLANSEIPVHQNPLPNPSPQPTPTPKLQVTPPIKPLIASLVLAPPLRGGQVPSLSIPAGTDRAAIRLELESDDFKFYSVELRDSATGRMIWHSGRVNTTVAGNAKFLNVTVPVKTLNPVPYTLSVSGMSPNGQAERVGDYSFRVMR